VNIRTVQHAASGDNPELNLAAKSISPWRRNFVNNARVGPVRAALWSRDREGRQLLMGEKRILSPISPLRTR
jgi:hypothetical protein